MEAFRNDNTEGYAETELQGFNSEWEKIIKEKNLEPYTDEYDNELKYFSDAVARR